MLKSLDNKEHDFCGNNNVSVLYAYILQVTVVIRNYYIWTLLKGMFIYFLFRSWFFGHAFIIRQLEYSFTVPNQLFAFSKNATQLEILLQRHWHQLILFVLYSCRKINVCWFWNLDMCNYKLCTNARFVLFFVARLLVRLVSLDVKILTTFCHCMLCIC